MLLYTHIARIEDGVALCGSVEADDQAAALRKQKSEIATLLAAVTPQSEPRASIVSGEYTIHYVLADGLMYFCITESKFPKSLVFSYLDEIHREFEKSHLHDALQPNVRPYQFAGFDKFIQKTKKLYQDQRATQNLDKINADLQDVSKVMSKNIEDLLYRGEKLDRMSDISTSLRYESKKYRSAARRINLQAMLRQYAPVVGIVLLVLFVLWWRFG